MSRRAKTYSSRRGETAATVALSTTAFVFAVVAVFLAVMWGESGTQTWGVLVGMMLPIALTLLAAVVLTAHLVRLRVVRGTAIRQRIRRELRAMFRTDLT
ncbi:hypothetical protein G5T42_14525 [Microbacterium sp. 4R-513]|uniref:hypothetical protein n=1 Tax=Microbacterium sp. 4R-513 TaxID=2567934 RepID=UPI0013E178E3|nr:hypothetical protein [Microbacterium sp. 4R-513]QIG40537.1 hypothetical protein G5T42_14525 [Microbacterium sp. 4R-513]